ncbi:hypothetical protein WA577_001755 [Blastocystis sp. JDR]
MNNRGRSGGGRQGENKGMPVFNGLPDYLKCLFVPDIQLQTLMAPEKKQPTPMTGLAVYLPEVVDDSYSVIDQFEKEPDPRDHDVTKKEEKKGKAKEILRREKQEKYKEELKEKIKNYNPDKNPKATKNAMNTLFIGNLSYLTTESHLREVCEKYGPIENLVLVKDLEGKPRGYAFVEFSYPDDLKTAYSRMNRMPLDGRNIIVDVERGRTVRKWLPARLGGGLGHTRLSREERRRLDREKEEERHRRHEEERRRDRDRDRRHDRDSYRDYHRDSHHSHRYDDDRRDRKRDDYRDRRREDPDRKRTEGSGRS